MIGLAKGTECVHRECYFTVWSCSLENWSRRHFARSMQTAVSTGVGVLCLVVSLPRQTPLAPVWV